ncbi:MAG TPA: FAD-binding oxidoreductase [Flexivirga sp.]|uniref:FAD-binding oxidoreductase n=1 Tax=Flexivirga sp. TaxID=1962927 RepID=UPI002B701891|nr:FAD-binding oxidoreductase [Flexivirga sp.]HWC22460.1 FAD-binding oxidoreductase [Flexivirga sp.]
MTTTTRRGVLALSGSSALAALTSCTPRANAVGALGAATAKPTTQEWVSFARTVNGPVDLPGSAPYNRAKLVFDTRFDTNLPAAVMVVERTADIARAMRFAERFNLQVTARGGGHSYVGASAANGTLVLDLRPLRSVAYDARSRTVRVASGASLYDVKAHLAPHGRGIPTGTCPTVGAAGLTLGGGLGVESRAHGLTADRLTAAQLVLPDGTSVTASATQHSDIFWALRGGGGGNIGIVTALRFATHAATGQGIFTLTFAGTAAVPVLTGWAGWIRATGRSRWAGVHVDATGRGGLHVSIVGVTTAGDERAAAASLVRAIGVSPTATRYRRLGYLDAATYLGGGTTSARRRFTAGSDVLASLGTPAASAIVRAVTDRSRAGGTGSALLDPLTGAVADPKRTDTAFPWRDHLASLQWYVGDAPYASAHDWIVRAHRQVAQFSSGGYVNYLETGQPAHRYFGGNLARLAQVRRRYDPKRRIHSGLVL